MTSEKLQNLMKERRRKRHIQQTSIFGGFVIIGIIVTLVLISSNADSRSVNQSLSDDLVILADDVGKEEYYEIMRDFHLIYSNTNCFSDIQGYSINFNEKIVEMYFSEGDTLIFSKNDTQYLLQDEYVNLVEWCEVQEMKTL